MCKKRRKFLEIDETIVVRVYHPESFHQFTLTNSLTSYTFSKLKHVNHVHIYVVYRYKTIVIRIETVEKYFL